MASLAAQSILRLSTQSLRSYQGRSFQLRNLSIPPTVYIGLRYRRSLATGSGKKDPQNGSPSSSNGTVKNSESKDAKPLTSNPNEGEQVPRKRQQFASLDFESTEETSDAQALITDGKTGGADGLDAGRKQRTGAKSAKDSLSSIEKRRRRLGWVSSIGLIIGLFGGWVLMGDDEVDGKREPGIGAWISRSNRNTLKLFDLFDKPIWEKLLPDPLPAGYQRPYTLLLSIDDLLVTSTWDRQNGWRTAKRPGVDYFLGYLSQFYEIVIFTTQTSQTSIPIIEQLDPFSFHIIYHLFRESTRTYKGQIVKDLSYLNRDLSKVVALDTVADRYALHPDNVIAVPKWKAGKKGLGEMGEGDQGLIGLIPFLEAIAIFEAPDVRPILEKYRGKDIAREYAKVEADNKRQIVENWENSHKNAGGLASGGWTIGRLIGNTPPAPKMPLTFLESRRAHAQMVYKEEMDYLEKNKAELIRQKEKAQEEGMKAMMEGGLFGMMSKMGLGPKLPESASPTAEETHSALTPTTPLPPSSTTPNPSKA